MRGLHPELCGWFLAAAGALEAFEQGAARAVSSASRGPDEGPEVREALAAAAWVGQRFRGELEERVATLFGAVSPVESTALEGLPTLVGAALAIQGAWKDALLRVDAHSRLLLRLQLAQWEAVVLPVLTAVCPDPDELHALRTTLMEHLPAPAAHPEKFLGVGGPLEV